MRRQGGQAIVLVALMLTVLIGMVALAIDGARAYATRRDLQAATDAAALAAGDSYVANKSYPTAEQAATTLFGVNLRLYAAASCSPGYTSPGVSPVTITCTYSDGSVLVLTVTDLGPGGASFALTGRRTISLAFAKILTNGTAASATASASSAAGNILYSPALAALSSAGCGGLGGSAISQTSGGTLTVVGDVASNGLVSVTAGNMKVGGDLYARCQASLPASTTLACYPSGAGTPCTNPDVAGTLKTGYQMSDPGYPLPAFGGAQPNPTNNVVLQPGSYATNPNFNKGVCWFLAGGVYKWTAGYTNDGDLVSNELKPPDEPKTNNNTQRNSPQFWDLDGAHCSGAFALNRISSANPILLTGSRPVEVTSVRTDTYGGTSYMRESAPSMCRTISTNAGAHNIQLQISNVPGAQSYNVYIGQVGSTCAGQLGFLANFAIPAGTTIHNDKLSTCPNVAGGSCSLNAESFTIDGTILTPFWTTNALASPDTSGAPPPDSETSKLSGGLPNQSPDRAPPPGGDRADENQCDTSAAALTTCPGQVTPGAVEFYVPNGGCMDTTNSGDTYVFSGYQFDWLVIYEPGAANPPANTCSNVLDASTNSAFVGFDYLPSAALDLPSQNAFESESTGGVMANTISFTGSMPAISFSTDFAPTPPATKLTS